VAIKILEHLSGKKDIVATATTAGTTTDKNEKVNHYKIIDYLFFFFF